MITLHVSKAQLQKFQRWAKKEYPKEIMSALWGCREGNELWVQYITPYKTGTNLYVVIEADEWMELEEERRDWKYQYIGTIHTHPQEIGEPKPSTHDIHSAAHDREPCWAVCNVWKREGKFKTNTQFYSAGPTVKVERK